MRDKLDTAKRRAEIDYRKRLAQKEQTAVHYRQRGELPSKKARLTERAKEAPPVNVELDQDVVAALDALEPTERDLDVLVQFFLNGADKLEGDDDGILEILTKKVSYLLSYFYRRRLNLCADALQFQAPLERFSSGVRRTG